MLTGVLHVLVAYATTASYFSICQEDDEVSRTVVSCRICSHIFKNLITSSKDLIAYVPVLEPNVRYVVQLPHLKSDAKKTSSSRIGLTVNWYWFGS